VRGSRRVEGTLCCPGEGCSRWGLNGWGGCGCVVHNHPANRTHLYPLG
jgi:hypothetical protein